MPLHKDEEAERLRAERNRAVGVLVSNRFRLCDIVACIAEWRAAAREGGES